MKKRDKVWILCFVCLIVFYVLFLFVFHSRNEGSVPVISFDQALLEISVKDDSDVLLEGVKAFDKEDGDLSNEVIIDSISSFDKNKERTVVYMVFDSDRHVSQATRKIKYKDYVKPRIDLKSALMSHTINNGAINVNSINQVFSAKSSVDGDISSKVSVQTQSIAEKSDLKVKAMVKDSTGESVELDLIYNVNRGTYSTDITLKKYLVYIKVGEQFDARKNIKDIQSKSMIQQPKQYLSIKDNVNNKVPGIYEVFYSFHYFGDNGLTKCIVVVE